MESGKIIVEFESEELGEKASTSCKVTGNCSPVTLNRQFVRLLGTGIATAIDQMGLDEEETKHYIKITLKEVLAIKDQVLNNIKDEDEDTEDGDEDYEEECNDDNETDVVDLVTELAKKFLSSDFYKEGYSKCSAKEKKELDRKRDELLGKTEEAKDHLTLPGKLKEYLKREKKSEKDIVIDDLINFLKDSQNKGN